MKSSFGKLGRKFVMQKSDVKETRDHQASAHLHELAQASKDMQDMRNCYDGLLSAAAATANSIYEFSESLNEMGNSLLGNTAATTDAESGNVLSTLGNLQLELQKVADTYRSNVIMTITNPTESLLSELQKVEEMKLQCYEKREVYDHMMTQHREKGKLKNGKIESSIAQNLHEAQVEYDELARLCVFRVKSLKEGQWRSLLTQAARHHAAQLNFFRKGLKAVEAVEPFIRNVAEKNRIDCQLSELYDRGAQEGEPMSCYESTNDGELSNDYKHKKQGLDDDDDDYDTSPNPKEVDVTYFQATNLEDIEINQNKHKGDQIFGRKNRVSSHSAPLFPDKNNAPPGKLKETKPTPKSHSYVLPPPVADTRNPPSKPATSVSHPNHPFQNQQPDNPSTTALTSKTQSTLKHGNINKPSIQLPAPSTGRFSFSQNDNNNYKTDTSKVDKQQSYSGPLPASRQFSFKLASNNTGPVNSSGPITSTELPQPPTRVSVSPKISELHELPRPPVVISGGLSRHSAPLLLKNQEISPPTKRVMLTSSCASPLPLPPVVKINSSNRER